MTLSYTRTGDASAPAILFLHGMAMGQWMWYEQTAHFADYDCYNIDLPGHGGSSPIAWESFGGAADAVAQLIDTVPVNKPLYLVGMSLGAVVGLHLLARHPGQITRAVLTGAFDQAPPRWLLTIQGTILSAILPTAVGRRLFARMLQLPADVMPDYEQSIKSLSMPAFRRIIGQIAGYTPPAGLEAVFTPTLLVTGEQDIALNRTAVQQLAGQLPNAVGVLAPAVHHGWNGEDPALFNAMTRAWLTCQPLPPSLIPVPT